MSIEPENLVRHELIGLKITVISSKDKSRKKIKGKIIDETQKTLKIRTKDGDKIIPKKECSFEIELPSKKKVTVDGKLLYGRPEERIKKRLPRKWDVL